MIRPGLLMLVVLAAALDAHGSSVLAQDEDGDWINAARRPAQAARPAVPLPQRKPPKPRRAAAAENAGSESPAQASSEPPASLPVPPPSGAEREQQEVASRPKAEEAGERQSDPAAEEPELDAAEDTSADDANEDLLPQSARVSERAEDAAGPDVAAEDQEKSETEPDPVPMPVRAAAPVEPEQKADRSAEDDAADSGGAAKMSDRLPRADDSQGVETGAAAEPPQPSPPSEPQAIAAAPVEPEKPEKPEPALSRSWPHEARIAGLAVPVPTQENAGQRPSRLAVPLPVKKPKKPARRAERRETPAPRRERSTGTPRPPSSAPAGTQAAKCAALGKCRDAFAKCKAAFIKKNGEWDLEKEPCGAVYQACIRKSFQPGEMFFTRWFWPYDNCP